MKLIVLLVCIYLSQAAVVKPVTPEQLSGQELVDFVNSNQNLFQAQLPKPDHVVHRKLMKLKYVMDEERPPVDDANEANDINIPESFDAREKWPHCPSLTYIRDQSNCGSCWAVSSAEAMSDRLCIATEGKVKVELSAQEMVSCCDECGYGCDGGWPINAWKYFANRGLVTGGNYGERNACRPYEIHPCGHHPNQTYYGECYSDAETPRCVRKCQPSYKIPYRKDKHFGKTAFTLPNSMKAIQKEIMTNGPVVAGYTVYSDFAYYKKGIYKHVAGRAEGGHAVKIIGWGKENGVPYWLVANSWNTDWGENGYFRIIRGINNCGFEQEVVGGLVDK